MTGLIFGYALLTGTGAALAEPPAAAPLAVQTPLSSAEQAGQERLQQLSWMAGSWSAQPRPLFTNEEMWTLPRRGSMLGAAREVFDQRTRSFEYMRVVVDRDGSLALYASPGGGPAVRFAIVEADGSHFVAENRAHDYPQRITYRRSGDVMTATISLADGSQAESWTYRRQP